METAQRIIPKEWSIKKVEDLFEIGRGRVISKKEIQQNPGPFPVYSSQTSNGGEFGKIGTYDFEGEYLTWTTDGIYAGAVFYRNGKFNCTNVCGTLKPRGHIDARFFSYLLPLYAGRHVVRTANPKLMNNVMARVSIPVPPIKEQKKISEILVAVDRIIRGTDEIIAVTGKLKRGLMQHFFAKSEWNRKKIADIAEVVTGGTPKTSVPEYWDGSIRWMSSGEVNLRRVRDTEKMITQKGFDNSNARMLPLGTVMVALAGQGKTRGKVAILEIETTCNQSLAGIIPNANLLSNEFLFYNLEYRYQELRDISGGEGRAGLNLKLIKEFVVPVPPLQEQKKIATALTSIDKKISINQKLKAELNLLKKGLMQDLLSGKVRVTI